MLELLLEICYSHFLVYFKVLSQYVPVGTAGSSENPSSIRIVGFCRTWDIPLVISSHMQC
jgi:hypothetical protein